MNIRAAENVLESSGSLTDQVLNLTEAAHAHSSSRIFFLIFRNTEWFHAFVFVTLISHLRLAGLKKSHFEKI